MNMGQYDTMPLTETQSVGMRAYFNRIYTYMAGGLVVSAGVAYLTTKEPFFSLFYSVSNGSVGLSVLGWIAVLAPLLMVFMISSATAKMNAERASTLFWIFSALMGVSLSNILLVYTGVSIFRTFLICSAGFLGLSLYGYTTKKSLTGLGSFLMMGLIGLIIAMIVNIFMKSAALDWALSVIGVLIFAGLTIFDTNKLKAVYHDGLSEQAKKSLAVSGALSLYLDFINLFQFLLSFLGDRR